jgi:hypothetical protein
MKAGSARCLGHRCRFSINTFLTFVRCDDECSESYSLLHCCIAKTSFSRDRLNYYYRADTFLGVPKVIFVPVFEFNVFRHERKVLEARSVWNGGRKAVIQGISTNSWAFIQYVKCAVGATQVVRFVPFVLVRYTIQGFYAPIYRIRSYTPLQ